MYRCLRPAVLQPLQPPGLNTDVAAKTGWQRTTASEAITLSNDRNNSPSSPAGSGTPSAVPRLSNGNPPIIPQLNTRIPLFEIVLLLIAAALGWATFHTYTALNEINRRVVPPLQFQQAEETRTTEPVRVVEPQKPQDPLEILNLSALLDLKNRYTDLADQLDPGLGEMRDALQRFLREKNRAEIRRFREKGQAIDLWMRRQQENLDRRKQQALLEWLATQPPTNAEVITVNLDVLLQSARRSFSNYLATVPLTEGQSLSPDLVQTKLARMTEPEQELLVTARKARNQATNIQSFVLSRQTPPTPAPAPPAAPRVTTTIRPIGDGGASIIAQFKSLQNEAREELQPIFYILISTLLVQCIITIVAFYNRIVVAPLRQRLIENNTAIEHQRKLTHFARLATGLAHEIRNPLTAISVRLFTLQKSMNKGTSEHSDASLIRNEVDRLEQILKNFLKLARPSEPKFMLLTAEPAFREVSDLLAPQLQRRGFALKLGSMTTLPFLADPLQLKQVLINLIQNAADSIEEGTGTVTLRARSESTGRGVKAVKRVTLEVEDSGSGMTPEVQERLFDPFFSTKESGTGLGLAIAAKIIEQHKGTLDFETRLGHGTVFRITLPASSQ